MAIKYEYSGREKYIGIRSDQDEISYEAFKNRVYFDEDKRTVHIKVDDSYEYDEDKNDDLAEEAYDDNESDDPFTEQDILNSGNDYIYRDVFHLSTPYDPPLKFRVNLFSGLEISFPVGEGILDFCYTDFNKELPYLKLMTAFLNKAKDKKIPEFRNRDEILFLVY